MEYKKFGRNGAVLGFFSGHIAKQTEANELYEDRKEKTRRVFSHGGTVLANAALFAAWLFLALGFLSFLQTNTLRRLEDEQASSSRLPIVMNIVVSENLAIYLTHIIVLQVIPKPWLY